MVYKSYTAMSQYNIPPHTRKPLPDLGEYCLILLLNYAVVNGRGNPIESIASRTVVNSLQTALHLRQTQHALIDQITHCCLPL
jgi:hypothetical protein